MISTQQQAQIYRTNTLRLLAKLGYASTRQIAKASWGSCSPSARTGAARVVRALIAQKLVVSKRDGDIVSGERLIALNEKGVKALESISTMPNGATHARNFLRHTHSHRTACNSIFAIYVDGSTNIESTGWSELEIRNRAETMPTEIMKLTSWQWRDSNVVLQKIPDVLIATDKKPVWIEAENSWRSAKDFDKLVSFLRAMFATDTPAVSQVLCVVTAPGAKTIGARLAKALHNEPNDFKKTRTVREIDARIVRDKLVNVLHLLPETLEFITTKERMRREELEAAEAKAAKHAKRLEDRKLKTLKRKII